MLCQTVRFKSITKHHKVCDRPHTVSEIEFQITEPETAKLRAPYRISLVHSITKSQRAVKMMATEKKFTCQILS